MKFLWLFILWSPFFSFTQSTDAACIYARWIELHPNEQNASLFNLDSTITLEKDLIQLIQQLVEKRELNLYHQRVMQSGQMEWEFIDYEEELEKAKNDSANFYKWRPYFTFLGPQSDIPLTDEYGEPIIRVNPDGMEEYVYPPRDLIDLIMKELALIKIKETRNFDEKTKITTYQPSDIGFCLKMDPSSKNRPEEIFWVSIEELDSAFHRNRISHSSLARIKNQDYSGFQYKQVSCEDGEILYFEGMHAEVFFIDDTCEYTIPLTYQLGYHQQILLKLKEGCSTKIYFGPRDSGSYIMHDIKKLNTKALPNLERDQNEQMYVTVLTPNDKGKYYLVSRGCVTYRPFCLIIE